MVETLTLEFKTGVPERSGWYLVTLNEKNYVPYFISEFRGGEWVSRFSDDIESFAELPSR